MNDDLETTLADELRRRSGDVLSTAGLADRARRKARVVRRRRAMAVGAVTAVALAVAVPSALSFRDVARTAPPPAEPPTAPENVATTELAFEGLPTGADPSVGWFEDSEFHHGDGRTVDFQDGWSTALELEDGYLAYSLGEVGRLDPDGEVTDRYPGAGPVLSPDGLVAHYDEDRNRIRIDRADGGGTGPGDREVAAEQRLEPIGFLGDHRLVSNVWTAGGTPAGIRIDDFAPGADPAPATPPWDLLRVTAASPAAGLVTGPTEVTDDGGCWAVYEVDSDEALWNSCEYAFTRFSPDGRYVAGVPGHPDDEAHPLLVVADARSGEVLHAFTGRHIYEVVFEDGGDLILDARLETGDGAGRRQRALLRCGVDGGCELARPVVGPEAGRTYDLAQQRW